MPETKIKTALRFVGNRAVISMTGAVVTTLAAAMIAQMAVGWDELVNFAQTPSRNAEAIQQNSEALADVANALERITITLDEVTPTLDALVAGQARVTSEIAQLQLPDKVLDISSDSGPVMGRMCVGGDPCRFAIRWKVTPGGAACTILDEATRYYYINPRSGEEYVARPIEPPSFASLKPARYSNTGALISTPYGLAPDARLCIELRLADCPGQTHDAPAMTAMAECFDVPIDPARRDSHEPAR